MNKILCAAALLLAACHGGAAPVPPAAVRAHGLVIAGLDWLAQKVCVDASNTPVAMDPAGGCGSYTERDMLATDAVPYYRTDGGSDYAYAFPINGTSNETMYVMPREFAPKNQPSNWYATPSYYPGHTHWDLYRIQNSWVSNATTRDNSGLNQIFLGNSSGAATPYNGWIDFPVAYLSNPGATESTNVPVHDLHWEQQGLPWPVPAQPAPTSLSTQTTWSYAAAYTFASGKQLPTIMSAHQSAPNTLLGTASSSKTVSAVGDNSSCSGVVDCATFVGGRTGIVAGAASLEIQISLDSTAITYQLVDGYIGGS